MISKLVSDKLAIGWNKVLYPIVVISAYHLPIKMAKFIVTVEFVPYNVHKTDYEMDYFFSLTYTHWNHTFTQTTKHKNFNMSKRIHLMACPPNNIHWPTILQQLTLNIYATSLCSSGEFTIQIPFPPKQQLTSVWRSF